MLRITPMGSSAKNYLREGLSKTDYYTNGEPILETWKGSLAPDLNLENTKSTIKDFDLLCDNVNPVTKLMLSARHVINRKAYYDFTFSAPKSVSILFGLTEDKELKEKLTAVMQNAVYKTMEFAETEFSLTRDKTNNQNRYLKSGKLLYTDFLHDTSRPVGGIPDPHLHIHCAVFNITKDPETQVFKAMEFHDFAKYRNLVEAVFHNNLARSIQNKLGLPVRNTYNSFELVGIDKDFIDKFSNRTKSIELFAQNKGITSETIKGSLGAKIREKKEGINLTNSEIKANWENRLNPVEKMKFNTLNANNLIENKEFNPESVAIKKAINHNFERSTVIDKKGLITFALNSNLAQIDYKSLLHEYEKTAQKKEIIDVRIGRQSFLTTKTIIDEELKIKALVNNSVDKTNPINRNFRLEKPMSPDQDRVFYSILSSSDGVKYIRGDAGTGKTYLIQNLKTAIESSGGQVFAYAPTVIAGRKVLREEVTKDANTIQSLLNNPKEQEKINSKSVIFIDEAGMIGYSDMILLLQLRENKNCNMILVGDTKQHTSVARGDALRYIETSTEINTLSLTNNRRQNNPEYKKAINQLAQKDLNAAFKTLENIGAIKEIPNSTKRYNSIAKEYINKINLYKSWDQAQKQILIVTPTHEESKIITNRVRRELKKEKHIDQINHKYTVLIDKRYTNSQKQNPSVYNKGDIILFNQNGAGGFIRGHQYTIEIDKKNLNPLIKKLEKNSNKIIKIPIPLQLADKFSVLRKEEINLSKGDLIQFTNTAKTKTGNILKGSIHSIKNIQTDSTITLDTNQILQANFGHIKHGYTSTSYSSQGRTVSNLIISQSEISLPASSFQQGYVSTSRGKESISIFTDNKSNLQKSMSISKEREFGTNLQKLKLSGKDLEV